MEESEIFCAVIKFLNHESNREELDKLASWMQDEQHSHVVYQAVKTHYLITLSMNDFDVAEAKLAMKRKLAEKKRKRWVEKLKWLAAAASIVVTAAVFYLFQVDKEKVGTPPSPQVMTGSTPKSKGILLTLESGDQVTLNKGKGYQAADVHGNGENLVYSQGDEKTTGSDHVITVPKAEQFFIQLADGTKVWLNADSKIKYPTSFGSNQPRKVELVYGEAYFEVKGQWSTGGGRSNKLPFIVKTESQEVAVLGTAFNVKAYADDPTVSTTLVEGKVMIRKEAHREILQPNQQAVVNKGGDDINIQSVDASQYISWISGLFTFEETSLEDVMKTLSRWYDVDVVYANRGAKVFVFTGVLERSTSIAEVLRMIEATSVGEVKFEVNGSKVFVN